MSYLIQLAPQCAAVEPLYLEKILSGSDQLTFCDDKACAFRWEYEQAYALTKSFERRYGLQFIICEVSQ